VTIVDQPRFPWRGLLLDVARHFFNKEEIKNFLDLMAQHKLNTLQLHLTDDQGWRIEIKRYPKLTEIGAWREGIDFGLNPKDGTAYGPDGRYGGFYTQDDIRELVAYARARHVTIVPEIEMPGHAGGALSAYPEFSCFGGPYDRDAGPMGICCPGNDATFAFLEHVLAEVSELFPGKYVHIGADEVDKAAWKRCPKCQARIKQEGLKNEHELQSYFVKRIERFINARGRTLIGWDEILEGGLAPNATVMSWRNIEAGVIAANAGHDVVMTPTSHCYLDFYQGKTGEPRAIGGFLPLATVYGFEPLPAGIAAEKAKHVLGAGGNLWSEFFPNYAQVQYMAYPRACAIAEVTWTDPQRKNWEDFRSRLDVHLQRLNAQGVHSRQPRADDDAPAK
jgi:hexosaminidase